VAAVRTAILISLALVARAASAEPCADPEPLRAELAHESARADHWNLGWGIGYTALADGQLAAAASGQFSHDNTQGLWVGGAKSAIGAIARWASPLAIELPAPTGDRCADNRALRAVAERTADQERRAFWLGHLGGLAVHLIGSAILVETASWKAAITSFALGYPVGLLTIYTMPRASWARVREPTWTAAVAPTTGGWSVVVSAQF
jgi:hypothetical protein